MSTLTKMALGLMGQLKPQPVIAPADSITLLPKAHITGGLPLMQALLLRQSQRAFESSPLPAQVLSDVLWAAAGINRPELGGRTVPSAMNAQEVSVYAALPDGLYRYAAADQSLHPVVASDVRRVTGYQDFVDNAPVDLIYVADHTGMALVPASQRQSYAWASAGAMAQNVYLYCASAGLATVLRAWVDRQALAQAMGLGNEQQVLMCQTLGRPLVVPGG